MQHHELSECYFLTISEIPDLEGLESGFWVTLVLLGQRQSQTGFWEQLKQWGGRVGGDILSSWSPLGEWGGHQVSYILYPCCRGGYRGGFCIWSILEILQLPIIQLQMLQHNIKVAPIELKMLLQSCLIMPCQIYRSGNYQSNSVRPGQFSWPAGAQMSHRKVLKYTRSTVGLIFFLTEIFTHMSFLSYSVLNQQKSANNCFLNFPCNAWCFEWYRV